MGDACENYVKNQIKFNLRIAEPELLRRKSEKKYEEDLKAEI